MLLDILKNKAQKGVDVRILGFVNPALMNSFIAQRFDSGKAYLVTNVSTIKSIDALRQEPTLTKKACLNIIGHTAGAVHVKMVVLSNAKKAWGFVGGIDFVNSRHTKFRWHDVQALIKGPAVFGLYNHFCNMWNENLNRDAAIFNVDGKKIPSFEAGAQTISDDERKQKEIFLSSLTDSFDYNVQLLRTIPQFNYPSYNILPESQPISFAPNGCFEIRTAWKKALLAATQYIYIEDQCFWSTEVMSWINEAIRTPRPDLRVILVISGMSDPSDPKFPDQAILTNSINKSLLKI